jgi:hypothetical protein
MGGADCRNRTDRCFVGDDAAHLGQPAYFESRDAELIRGSAPYSFLVMTTGAAASRELGRGGWSRTNTARLSAACTAACATPRKWSERHESNVPEPAPKAGGQPLSHAQTEMDVRTGLEPAWQRFAGVCITSLPPNVNWLERRDSHPLQTSHSRRARLLRFRPTSNWSTERDLNPHARRHRVLSATRLPLRHRWKTGEGAGTRIP